MNGIIFLSMEQDENGQKKIVKISKLYDVNESFVCHIFGKPLHRSANMWVELASLKII